MSAFMKQFLTGIELPEEYIPALIEVWEKLAAKEDFRRLTDRLMAKDYEKIDELLTPAAQIGEECGAHPYTSQFLLNAASAEPLLALYRERGVDEEIYWMSMHDLKWKFHECLERYNVPGSFVAHWFPRFFHMTRFALGRLQFEHATFNADSYSACGVELKRGDDVINIHIPSAGPLTKESRMDAYRRAYRFFKKDFEGDILPIVCHSWLLYPAHREFLPAHSNILSFMDDFDILFERQEEPGCFGNAWRVFGAAADRPMDTWPSDTGLRRAYLDWLRSGKGAGNGYGVILFDGENIVNKK